MTEYFLNQRTLPNQNRYNDTRCWSSSGQYDKVADLLDKQGAGGVSLNREMN